MIPNLKKTELSWEGMVQLVEWNKYYEQVLSLILNVGGDCIVDEISSIHKRGYQYLLEEQSNILKVAIIEVYKYYPVWQEEYGFNEQEKKLLMPDLVCKDDLKKLMNPKRLFIMDIESNGIPYLGIEFQCSWDDEHGVGIMLHGDRVVKIGGADAAFLSWIAEEDKENLELRIE